MRKTHRTRTFFGNNRSIESLYDKIPDIQSHSSTTRGLRRLASLTSYSRVSGPSGCRCFQTLTVLFQFIFRVDGHVHRRTFAKRKY